LLTPATTQTVLTDTHAQQYSTTTNSPMIRQVLAKAT